MIADRENPWLGLAAYTEEACEFFFGRDREIGELVRLVEDESLTVLYGISGLGKTSLLQAGIFPQLRKNDFFPVAIRLAHRESEVATGRPASVVAGTLPIRMGRRATEIGTENRSTATEPLPSHTTSVLGILCQSGTKSGEKFAESIDPRETLWEFFHRLDRQFWSERHRLLTPVLVLDQFEEIFTVGQESEAQRNRSAAFLQELAELIYNRVPVSFQDRLDREEVDVSRYTFDKVPIRVALSLREDFLPQLSELRERGFPTLLRSSLWLRPLAAPAALQVVELPGCGVDLLEPGVAAEIVKFVANAPSGRSEPVEDPSASAGTGAAEARSSAAPSLDAHTTVEPALLSVVCRELNNERRRRHALRIGKDLLNLKQEQILADFYERAFDGVSEEARHFVEDEVLSPTGYRDSRSLEDALSRPGISQIDILRLIDRRLLHYEERQDGKRRLELTHDLLCRVAAASRRKRVEDEKQRSAEEAAKRAEEEVRLAAERVERAEADREKERRAREEADRLRGDAEAAKRRAGRFAVAAAIVALFALAALAFALVARTEAQRERNRAVDREQMANDAKKQALAANAETEKQREEADKERQRALAGEQNASEEKGRAVAARQAADELIFYMQHDLSETLRKLGSLKAMDGVNQRILQSQEQHPSDDAASAEALRNQGDVLRDQGRLSSAMTMYRKAEAIMEQSTAQDPDPAEQRGFAGPSLDDIGDLLTEEGRLGDALGQYERAFASRKAILEKTPENAAALSDIALSHKRLGNVLCLQGAIKQALDHCRASYSIRSGLATADPESQERQRDLAESDADLGDVFAAQGSLPEALKEYHDSVAIRKQLAESDPDNRIWQRDLAKGYLSLGCALLNSGDLPRAEQTLQLAFDLSQRLVKRDPENAAWNSDLAAAGRNLGSVAMGRRDFATARKEYERSLGIHSDLVKSDPENADWQRDLAASENDLGNLSIEKREFDRAVDRFNESLAIVEKLVKQDPDNTDWQKNLADSYLSLASALFLQPKGDRTRIATLVASGLDIVRKLEGQEETSADLAKIKKALELVEARLRPATSAANSSGR